MSKPDCYCRFSVNGGPSCNRPIYWKKNQDRLAVCSWHAFEIRKWAEDDFNGRMAAVMRGQKPREFAKRRPVYENSPGDN